MKFSKCLQAHQASPLFRGLWITYRSLKKLIKEIVKTKSKAVLPEVYASQLWWYDATQKTSLGSVSQERIAFVRLVESEINKTSLYYLSKRTWISSMLLEIHRRLDGDCASDIIQDIDDVAVELLTLDRYIHQAKQLLLKIIKKHDKCTQIEVQPWMLIRLEKEEFWNPKIDDIVIGLSDAYTIASNLSTDRRSSNSSEEGSLPSSPPAMTKAASQDFVRKNDKYFIKPEDVLLVKLAIIRHLPLDIFGRVPGSRNKKQMPTMDLFSDLQDNTVINSVYLDNDQKTMYHERTGIETKKGNLVRIRWYGSHPNPPAECYVERKTRQTPSADNKLYKIDEAIKERFQVNARNIKKYVSGEWTIDKKAKNLVKKGRISQKDAAELKRKANTIQEEIVSKAIHPVLRTVVRRSAFQRGSDQTLRFSLDTNLHIINEQENNSTTGWARDLSDPLCLAEVKTLPYAVLEVKTQAQAPAWVQDLIHSGYLIPAPNFSKFLYGTCKLWPSHVRFTPNWWTRVMELEKYPPDSPLFEVSYEPSKTISHNPFFRPQTLSSLPSHPSMLSLDLPAFPSSPSLPSPSDLTLPTFSHKQKEREKEEVVIWGGGAKGGGNDEARVMLLTEDDASSSSTTSQSGSPRSSESGSLKLANFIPSPVLAMFGMKGVEGVEIPMKDYNEVRTKKQKASEQRVAKAFFANERTLLSWINTATFLSLTGLALISTEAAAGKAAGLMLMMVTLSFACYALFKYWQRLDNLERPVKMSKGDKIGPVALILSFCACLLLSAVYYFGRS